MLNEQEYITQSLELHLFFARIMKEHSLFLEAGFLPKDVNFSIYADELKTQFEMVLYQIVVLSNGLIRPHILNSGEIVTDFTLDAEKKTQKLTGISIDQNITMMASNLSSMSNVYVTPQMIMTVKQINEHILNLLDNLISFKMQVLDCMLTCHMFTANYPLLIKHILREAKLYRKQLLAIENGISLDNQDIKEEELFWDQIMMEHALFIRGLLDPTEKTLIQTSDDFAKTFERLLEKTKEATNNVISNVTNETLDETIKIRDFKTAGVKGLNECKIQAIILPLLADHVLREANHFIRILKQ